MQGEEELHWEKMLTELNVERKDKGLDEGAGLRMRHSECSSDLHGAVQEGLS